MAQSHDVKPHTGEPTHEMEGLLTPRDFELGAHRRWRLAYTPPSTIHAASGNPNRRVSWSDTGRANTLGLVQQARQNLRQSLASAEGVSQAVTSMTTRDRFSARAGDSECVIYC